MTNPPPIIEITDLLLARPDSPDPYEMRRLTVAPGDVIAIDTPRPNDARRLLRVLATLKAPESGRYRFKRARVDPRDYRRCLPVKRQIGYVADDAALISNRTIRENLLLPRFYAEDDLTIALGEQMFGLCHAAGLAAKLDLRPSALSDAELLKAIAIREMGKAPAVMLLDHPENFMEVTTDTGLFGHLRQMLRAQTALVFISNHNHFADLANRHLTLSERRIQWR